MYVCVCVCYLPSTSMRTSPTLSGISFSPTHPSTADTYTPAHPLLISNRSLINAFNNFWYLNRGVQLWPIVFVCVCVCDFVYLCFAHLGATEPEKERKIGQCMCACEQVCVCA